MVITIDTATATRAEVGDAINKLNEVLYAHDLGDAEALKRFAAENATAFEVVRADEVQKKLADVGKKVSDLDKPEPSPGAPVVPAEDVPVVPAEDVPVKVK